MLLEDVDFTQIGFSDQITDIRIYFDWSTFYCSALPNLVDVLIRIKQKIGRSVIVYAPLYPDDKTMPGDVKRYLVDNAPDIVQLMMVYGSYPLFDWNDQSRINDLETHVNSDMYLMISTYE